MPRTYNGDLAAEVILDLARLDRIGGILGDNLVQIWQSFSIKRGIVPGEKTHV